MEKTIEIPEGYEARIEGNKVILEPKESEDEWMINELQGFLSSFGSDYFGTGEWQKFDDWLEKQKEQRSEINIEHLKSYMLQYLQDASNREDDSEIESDTDKWAKMIIKVFGGIEQKPESCDCSRDEESYTNGIHHVLMNPEAYGLIKQKPAEWSEEDKALLKEIVSFFKDGTTKLQHDLDLYAGFLENKLKSLHSQPHWKPSKEQMDHLAYAYTQLKLQKCYAPHVYETLGSLYDDLKKHFSL